MIPKGIADIRVQRTPFTDEGIFTLFGKKIGWFRGEVYFTERDSAKHFYRKEQGYPLSVHLIQLLKNIKIKKIRFIEKGRNDFTTRIYEVYVSDYDNLEPFQENPLKPMTDWQKCVPLRRMKLINIANEYNIEERK